MTRTGALWTELHTALLDSDPLIPYSDVLDGDPLVELDGLLRSGGRPPVTFAPDSPLILSVSIALGADLRASPSSWTWTDITPYARWEAGISEESGRPDESGFVRAGKATLTLNNRDGRFSRKNPTGPYYGRLQRNTPIWAKVNAGSGAYSAVEMFVNEWPARFDKTETDFWTPIVCGGLLRRLGVGQDIGSALTRSVKRRTDNIGYWPLEDGANATVAASGITGGKSLRVTSGSPAWAATPGSPGSDDLLNLSSGGTIEGTFAAPSVPTVNRIQLLLKASIGAEPASGEFAHVLNWTTPGGTYVDWNMYLSSTGNVIVTGDGANVINLAPHTDAEFVDELDGTSNVYDDEWHCVEFGQRYNASTGDLIHYLSVDFSVETTGPFFGGAGQVLRGPTAVIINPENTTDPSMPSIGHLRFTNTDIDFTSPDPLGSNAAMNGYPGESAAARIGRVCTEEGVPVVANHSATGIALGAQPTGTLLDIVRDAEEAAGGVLYETGFGLGYQDLSQRYTAPVAMTLNFSNGDVNGEPEPTDDDQKLRNRWTITRRGGSSAIAEDATSIANEGLYDDGATINVQTDAMAGDVAGYRVSVGIDDDLRWPAIDIRFDNAAGRQLIESWINLPFGARIALTNPPANIVADTIDVFVEGRSQHFTNMTWEATLNTSPAHLFDVFQIESPTSALGRLDTDTMTLAANVASGATSLSITCTGVLATTDAAQFPVDIALAGERMTLTAVAGGASPQTFTVTRGVNGVVKAQTAGTPVHLWRGGGIAL